MILTADQHAAIGRLQDSNPRCVVTILPRGAVKGHVGVRVAGRHGAQQRAVRPDGSHYFVRWIDRPSRRAASPGVVELREAA